MMNKIYLFRLAVTGCVTFALVSCAAPGDPKVSQARDKFESRNTYAEGIGIGAAGGAAAGALIGGFSNGKKFEANRAAIGAGAGAVAGAATGGAYANQKVQERRAYQRADTGLENAIAQAKSTKKAAAKFNVVLAAEVRKTKAGDADLEGTIHDAEKVLGSIQKEVANQKETLQQAREQGISLTARNELRREIDALGDEESQLNTSIARLDKKANTSVANR